MLRMLIITGPEHRRKSSQTALIVLLAHQQLVPAKAARTRRPHLYPYWFQH
jgi:DNA mismatch repair ATPase MutS